MKSSRFNVVDDLNEKTRSQLTESLRRLKTRFGASALKLSTEDAAMSFPQIEYWSRIASGVMPVVVKIGGPNARNDIKQLLSLSIDGFIAPMVESPYGLENYMEAVQDFATPRQFKALSKHINIETTTAVEQLDAILDSPAARHLDEITIGRQDLSKSMKKPIHDPSLLSRVKKTVQLIRSRNIKVSIGGGIVPGVIDLLLEDIQPDKFNTRIITFDVEHDTSYRDAVRDALQFEITMLENDRREEFISREEEKIRVEELGKRLASSE